MEEVEWIKIEYLPDEYRDDRDGIQHKMVNIEDGDLILRLEKMLDGVEVERFGDTKNVASDMIWVCLANAKTPTVENMKA